MWAEIFTYKKKSNLFCDLENWLRVMELWDSHISFISVYKWHISKLSPLELKKFIDLCKWVLDRQKNKEVQWLVTHIQNHACNIINTTNNA